MSDPLPAQVFNLMYDARPDDIGARYAAGIEQAGVYGSSRGEATAADAGAPPREPHHLLPTPDPIDPRVVKSDPGRSAVPYSISLYEPLERLAISGGRIRWPVT